MSDIQYTTDDQIEQMRQDIAKAKQGIIPRRRSKEKSGKRSRDSARSRRKKMVSFILFSCVVVLLSSVLVSVLVAKSKGETPSLMGYQLYVVESGSMKPTIEIGAIIITKQVENPSALQLKDIVTFKTLRGATVTHRIIKRIVDDQGHVKYQTKGDNPKNSPDRDLLTPDRVIAKFVGKVPLT